MTRNSNFNDWQDLKINKDIEKISRKIDSQKTFNMVITIQLSVSLVTLILSLFSWKPQWVSITLTVLAILLLVSVLVLSLKEVIEKKSFSLWKKKKSISFIEEFDNRISRNVMTSYELLNALLSSEEKRSEILLLQTQEAYYYLTKSIRIIYDSREHLENSIMTGDSNDCFKNKKIHLKRFNLIIRSITNLHEEINRYAIDKFNGEKEKCGICDMYLTNNKFLSEINKELELILLRSNSSKKPKEKNNNID